MAETVPLAHAGTTLAEGIRRVMLPFLPLVAVALIWGAIRATGDAGPGFVDWLPGAISLAIAAAYVHRASRAPGLHPAGRRFWRAIAAGLLFCAPVIWAMDHLRADAWAPVAVTLLVLAVVASLLGLVALMLLPPRQHSKGDGKRMGYDIATVVVCVATCFWLFLVAPRIKAGAGTRELLTMAALSTVGLLAIFCIVRLMRIGTDAVDSLAMRVMAVLMLMGPARSALSSLDDDPRFVWVNGVAGVLGGMIAALAGLLQQRRAGSTIDTGKKRRAYSLMPYVAVGAMDVLLIAVSLGDPAYLSGQLPVIVLGAVATSGIVAARQLLALRDNGALLDLLEAKQVELRVQATHDPLTGLANRALFGERLDAALAQGGPVALLLIDLDDFKIVNDTLGHEAGDALLIEVGDRVRTALRPNDLIARLGGDEFAVLLPGLGEETAGLVADRILARLQPPIVAGPHRMHAAASIGVADTRDGGTAQELLRNADGAMYTAKRVGKNRRASHRVLPATI